MGTDTLNLLSLQQIINTCDYLYNIINSTKHKISSDRKIQKSHCPKHQRYDSSCKTHHIICYFETVSLLL